MAYSSSLEKVINNIVHEMIISTNASSCSLALLTEESDQIIRWMEIRRTFDKIRDLPGTSCYINEHPFLSQVLESREPVLVQYTEPDLDKKEKTYLQNENISSMVVLPLIIDDHVSCIIELVSDSPIEFTPENIAFCQKTAQEISNVIIQTNLLDEVQQHLNVQLLFYEALGTVTASLDFSEVLNRLCEQLCVLLGTTSVYVSIYDPNTQYSTVVADYISDEASEQEKISDIGESYYEDDKIFLKFIETGIPSIDQIRNPELGAFEREHMDQFGSKTVLYIPLRMKGKIKGYIEIWESRYHRDFTNIEISISEAIANQTAVAIENAQLYEQLQEELAERKRSEQIALEAEENIRSYTESSPDHIIFIDTDLIIRYVNYPSPGLTIDQLVGKPMISFAEKDQQSLVKQALETVLKTEKPVTYETTFTAPDGKIIVYESRVSLQKRFDEVVGLIINSRDISSRKDMEKRLEFLASHDPLTNLSNRRLFFNDLTKALNIAKRQNFRVSVAIIDLDDFKRINDTYGHLFGDLVLIEIAKRLKHSVRETDTVARLGGDEFVILFINPEDTKDFHKFIVRLKETLSKPMIIEGKEISISGSIGTSSCLGGTLSPEEIFNQADTAMYQGKNQIKNE